MHLCGGEAQRESGVEALVKLSVEGAAVAAGDICDTGRGECGCIWDETSISVGVVSIDSRAIWREDTESPWAICASLHLLLASD